MELQGRGRCGQLVDVLTQAKSIMRWDLVTWVGECDAKADIRNEVMAFEMKF